MRLTQLSSILHEMAGPAQYCTICGQGPLHKTHTYKAGAWYCKKAALAAAGKPVVSTQATTGGTSTTNPHPTPSSTLPPSGALTPKVQSRLSTNQPVSPETKIKQWLQRFGITNYTIHVDGTVDVNDSVVLDDMHWTKLPVKFGIVAGDFICVASELETLMNFPTRVAGDCIVSHNFLTSLHGCPEYVGGSLSFVDNTTLTSLDGIASHIGEDLDCVNCPIDSLHNIHKMIKFLGGTVTVDAKSHVLGVMLIDGVTSIRFPEPKVSSIINAHLSGDRNIHACQEDLIDAGFGAYAKI